MLGMYYYNCCLSISDLEIKKDNYNKKIKQCKTKQSGLACTSDIGSSEK